jgi:hypothetical protein
VKPVLIDRYAAPDEVAGAVLTFPTSSASSTSTPSAPSRHFVMFDQPEQFTAALDHALANMIESRAK